LEPTTFVDYGCGSALLLLEAKRLGWKVIGVEWDEGLANEISTRAGVQVVSQQTASEVLGSGVADVLHLGDVIEHLTSVNTQMPSILGLLKPTGMLVAQGPLQANATVFNGVLRAVRSVTRRFRRTEVVPQHVMLASTAGQRAFFERFGLGELEFEVWETNWPAPSSLCLGDLLRPRTVALYCLASVSSRISRLRPGRWGNRYFYRGRLGKRTGEAAS